MKNGDSKPKQRSAGERRTPTPSEPMSRQADLSQTESSQLDAPRHAVLAALAARGLTLKEASRALGRNDAYLQQYVHRRSPRRLPEELRHALAMLVGCAHDEFLDPDDTLVTVRGGQTPVAFFDDVAASAGGGALNAPDAPDLEDGDAPFLIPTRLLRQITSSPSASLRLITIRGDSMAPVLEDGDIVMVDCAQTQPSPPGIFVVDDGVGLVAKRLDLIPNTEPQRLRLTSENSHYSNYQRRIDEVHIVGRVVWFARSL